MNAQDALDKIKELISGGNLDDAKQFFEDHKDDLGDYADQAKGLLGGGADGIMDSVKNLFGK
ncbi:hypothetical protein ABVF11_00330 [Pediococcus argentinicus]|uniref:hypothetical protein n=1 Tax=Pediococcus argentinicus TaxID=480391 RepID=UPI00338ED788